MSDNFIGEIRPVGFNFAPVGWALCQGQLMPISEYEALFTLIGTTYGGDGQQTFGLPNLQSRIPIHNGTLQGGGTYPLGSMGGAETITLNTNQIPLHNHGIAAQGSAAAGTQQSPANNFFSASGQEQFGTAVAQGINTAPILMPQGGNQSHSNIQPYLCVNYIIALFGFFPSAG